MTGDILFGQSFEDYQKSDGVNASYLCEFARSPALAQYRRLNPREEKPSLLTGKLVHRFLLEPEIGAAGIVVRPETYTNDKGEEKLWHTGAKACKEWNTARESEGKTIIS